LLIAKFSDAIQTVVIMWELVVRCRAGLGSSLLCCMVWRCDTNWWLQPAFCWQSCVCWIDAGLLATTTLTWLYLCFVNFVLSSCPVVHLSGLSFVTLILSFGQTRMAGLLISSCSSSQNFTLPSL